MKNLLLTTVMALGVIASQAVDARVVDDTLQGISQNNPNAVVQHTHTNGTVVYYNNGVPYGSSELARDNATRMAERGGNAAAFTQSRPSFRR